MRHHGLSEDGKVKLLYKLADEVQVEKGQEYDEKDLMNVVFLDVETTGLEFRADEIIEIGLIDTKVHVNRGKIVTVTETLNALNQPGKPISKEITKITGITNEDVKGQKLPLDRIEKILSAADLIIAHNADFDRKFVNRISKSSTETNWGCSLTQIPWEELDVGCRKLGCLCEKHGFFFDAHRALSDVLAVIELLRFEDETGIPYLSYILSRAFESGVLVKAIGAPFESKDILKADNFKWNPTAKYWHKEIRQGEKAKMIDWLSKEVYRGKRVTAQLQELSSIRRFS